MIIKLLGILDFIAGLILLTSLEKKLPLWVCLFFTGFLISKSLIGFLKTFASWLDLISALTFLLLIFLPLPIFLKVIIGILILQKGFFSFFN
jgi:hypothetical protein